MGIPSYEILNWQNKRLYGMVLFEDIPQLIIQIIYIFVTQDDSSVIKCMYIYYNIKTFNINIGVIYNLDVSIVWTGLSILSSIFSFITNKSISDNNEFIILSMDIHNDNIDYKSVRSEIIKKLAIMLRIPVDSISVLKPLIISQGICVKFILNTKTNITGTNSLTNITIELERFKDCINIPLNIKILIKQMNESWKLDGITNITNIDMEYLHQKQKQVVQAQTNHDSI